MSPWPPAVCWLGAALGMALIFGGCAFLAPGLERQPFSCDRDRAMIRVWTSPSRSGVVDCGPEHRQEWERIGAPLAHRRGGS